MVCVKVRANRGSWKGTVHTTELVEGKPRGCVLNISRGILYIDAEDCRIVNRVGNGVVQESRSQF